jgi:hypothetical protein
MLKVRIICTNICLFDWSKMPRFYARAGTQVEKQNFTVFHAILFCFILYSNEKTPLNSVLDLSHGVTLLPGKFVSVRQTELDSSIIQYTACSLKYKFHRTYSETFMRHLQRLEEEQTITSCLQFASSDATMARKPVSIDRQHWPVLCAWQYCHNWPRASQNIVNRQINLNIH